MEQRVIYVAAILACILCALTVLFISTLNHFTRIVTSADEETPRLRFSGSLRWIPLIGRRASELENLVAQLRQSDTDHRTRYKILTENVAAAVMLHEADGTILWCSPFTEVITGFPLSEIYRNKSTFLTSNVQEEDREIVQRSLQIVATGEPFQCRYRFYHKSGMALWLETRTVPILDNASSEYVALSITIDVTAHVMNQLQVEERNKDLNEFTYMLSHDLKAPILTVSGMLGILEEEDAIKNNPQLAEPLTYIRKATKRLQDLVSGVLELARISATERSLEPIRLTDVITEVLEEHRIQIQESDAKITTVTELPIVLGNKTQLYQVFSNLIGNAIKYKMSDRPLVISIGSEKALSRRKTSIVVSDNGRGISSDKIDSIFKPFNRGGEETIEGTGVGLASVKKLVEKLGGSIKVESEQDHGTSFTIELRKAPDSVGA
jgi:PAS domain S-box-containing protein